MTFRSSPTFKYNSKIYTDDKKLFAELMKIKKQRNKVVHQGLLMNEGELKDIAGIHAKVQAMEKLHKKAEGIFYKILGRGGELEKMLNQITAERTTGQGIGGKRNPAGATSL